MDEQGRLKEEIGRQMEKIQQINRRIQETQEPDQKTISEWINTIRQLTQTMKQTLIDAGKTYLLDQLHTCWICNQHNKVESVYTAGIIFCNNKKCEDHFYYWSMCKTLYGGIPEEIFNQAKEELIKEKDNTLIMYH